MRVVWQLGAATTLVVLAFAMSAPLLAISLQHAGHDTSAIGAFAMQPFLMVGLLIPAMPRLLARWGLLRAYRVGTLLVLAGSVAYVAGNGLVSWSLGSVVAGTGVAALWNATEALLAQEAPADQRGRVMGLYQTALGAALAMGPFVPGLVGWGVRPLLGLGTALIAVGCAVALRIPDHHLGEPRPGQLGTWHALQAVPGLAWLAFVGGVFEAGLASVSAAHASAIGLGLSAAASVAGAIGAGSFLSQYPAGLAADRFSMRAVFATAAAMLLAGSLLFAWADRAPWLMWAVGTVWGGVGGALYTLTMVQVAHTFEGRATAGGTAAMITGYTLGGTVGPLASGAALDATGTVGLAVMLCLLALSGVAVAGMSRQLKD